jgi:hypothetical protein
MTFRPMLTYSEVWPLGADEASIWLLSGDVGPWPSEYISDQSDQQTMAEIELIQHGVTIGDGVLHSTSWRVDYSKEADRNFGIYTFMAVVPINGLVLDRWPNAMPITPELSRQLGQPPSHGAAELPEVPYWFALKHGLRYLEQGVRHLRYLRDTDTDIRVALDDHWRQHLEAFAPELARMYLREPA